MSRKLLIPLLIALPSLLLSCCAQNNGLAQEREAFSNNLVQRQYLRQIIVDGKKHSSTSNPPTYSASFLLQKGFRGNVIIPGKVMAKNTGYLPGYVSPYYPDQRGSYSEDATFFEVELENLNLEAIPSSLSEFDKSEKIEVAKDCHILEVVSRNEFRVAVIFPADASESRVLLCTTVAHMRFFGFYGVNIDDAGEYLSETYGSRQLGPVLDLPLVNKKYFEMKLD